MRRFVALAVAVFAVTMIATGSLAAMSPEKIAEEIDQFASAMKAVFPEIRIGDTEALAAQTRELLEKRNRTQPTQQPNAGSVFRNPPGDYAARLIEATGLKGFCIGGACVSEKHATFIVNTGKATAADIDELIESVAASVECSHGVRLVREVHIVGEQA